MATGPQWYFGFGSLMELLAFIIAIAIANQALKGYKLSKEKTLLYLNISFVLIGAGLLVDSLSSFMVFLTIHHRVLFFAFAVGYSINFFAQVLAYGLLVYAYIHQARNVSGPMVLAAVPFLFFERNAVTELILIFLLVYIATQTGINYSLHKGTNSMLVFGAFLSLTFAHVFFMIFTVIPIFYPIAHVAQLIGFLLLLAMLLRVNRPT